MRKFGKGDAGQLADLGQRLTGSFDLYGDDGRSAYSSVNFITCHDGFTLCDLVTYNHKHNDANGENNCDGSDDNNSWNCGFEGETSDPEIIRLRKQLVKNYLCMLIFSSGTPMILGGDEFMRTQRGNNNAYCQDNEISWFDWKLAGKNADISDFFRKAVDFTKRYTILQRRKFFLGKDLNADNIPDLSWFGTDGREPCWWDNALRALCFRLDGGEENSENGCYHLFFILNSDHTARYVNLPNHAPAKKWWRVIDTSLPRGEDFLEHGKEILIDPPDHYIANPRSVVVLLGTG